MKNSWIKVEEALPVMHFIHDNWSISAPMLVVRKGGDSCTIASYETYNGDTRWSGYVHYRDVTHWQPLELPDETI